ncbi:ATP synthase subunit I [Halofilum ochraceum]|uniref:ATP synthase subunit I n=1 Tax=Halofilum ochraceum TaxID=1611323 RepID=UPI00158677DA|nr:ATP synthase subunit I [Halofilum ochraceum]
MNEQLPSGASRLRPVRRLLLAQAGTGAVAAGIAWLAGGDKAALAAALGGLTCLLAQVWFAWRVFAADPAKPAAMLGALYIGEGVKLASIAVAFMAIFRVWPEVPPLPLILAFIAVQTVHWFAPLLLEQ